MYYNVQSPGKIPRSMLKSQFLFAMVPDVSVFLPLSNPVPFIFLENSWVTNEVYK